MSEDWRAGADEIRAALRAREGIPGPSRAGETRATRGATTDDASLVSEGGATKRREADPPSLGREGISSRALRRHILFLCVANSSRSQMAEGIARALAPPGIRVSSAGSEPTRLNPLAVQALAEIGIDISGQRSKRVDEIPPDDVSVVVTLCAEEVCPAFLGRAVRVHWGLPDPAAAPGTDAERLQAFRQVRDELRRRLGDALRL